MGAAAPQFAQAQGGAARGARARHARHHACGTSSPPSRTSSDGTTRAFEPRRRGSRVGVRRGRGLRGRGRRRETWRGWSHPSPIPAPRPDTTSGGDRRAARGADLTRGFRTKRFLGGRDATRSAGPARFKRRFRVLAARTLVAPFVFRALRAGDGREARRSWRLWAGAGDGEADDGRRSDEARLGGDGGPSRLPKPMQPQPLELHDQGDLGECRRDASSWSRSRSERAIGRSGSRKGLLARETGALSRLSAREDARRDARAARGNVVDRPRRRRRASDSGAIAPTAALHRRLGCRPPRGHARAREEEGRRGELDSPPSSLSRTSRHTFRAVEKHHQAQAQQRLGNGASSSPPRVDVRAVGALAATPPP